MNEQLRKAIEEATRVETYYTTHLDEDTVRELDHIESKAKLLRVIEMLVEQRDKCISSSHLFCNEIEDVQAMNEYDAELIATLERK